MVEVRIVSNNVVDFMKIQCIFQASNRWRPMKKLKYIYTYTHQVNIDTLSHSTGRKSESFVTTIQHLDYVNIHVFNYIFSWCIQYTLTQNPNVGYKYCSLRSHIILNTQPLSFEYVFTKNMLVRYASYCGYCFDAFTDSNRLAIWPSRTEHVCAQRIVNCLIKTSININAQCLFHSICLCLSFFLSLYVSAGCFYSFWFYISNTDRVKGFIEFWVQKKMVRSIER